MKPAGGADPADGRRVDADRRSGKAGGLGNRATVGSNREPATIPAKMK